MSTNHSVGRQPRVIATEAISSAPIATHTAPVDSSANQFQTPCDAKSMGTNASEPSRPPTSSAIVAVHPNTTSPNRMRMIATGQAGRSRRKSA